MYDYRGADGTGSKNNKVVPDSTNAVSYTVRKLADGNCWMVSNLSLELSTTKAVEVVVNETGEPVNEDRTDATYGNIVNGMWTPTSCGTNGTCAINGNTMRNSAYNSYHYSWYAATAGSGTSSMTKEDAHYSICPKSWRLPANYSYSDESKAKSFGSITNTYLDITENIRSDTSYQVLGAFPLNFLRVGGTNDMANNSAGYYWTSTASTSAIYAYDLDFATYYISPQGDHNKYYGFNIRCVAV